MTAMMRAANFLAPGHIQLADKPIPGVGSNDALRRITIPTICGTAVHFLKGEYPASKQRDGVPKVGIQPC
jgi:threonine dehydrogenase-like Zn-dependent dehydrogenase